MNIKVTESNCIKAIQYCKRKFDRSNAPSYLKAMSRRMNIVVKIYNRKGKIVAGAIAISKRCRFSIRKRLNLKHQSTTTIKGKKYYLVIEVNPLAFSRFKRTSLRYLRRVMGHELGHILMIIKNKEVDGSASFSTKEDHNSQWVRLSRYYGGNDSEYIS